jgi:DNA-binding MarR family transcriptional regulator
MSVDTISRESVARPGVRNVAILAWLRLARVFQKMDRISADGFRCRNLSVAQFDVLAQVGAQDGPTQQELADALLVTKGNVCQLLDRMEQTGLLERRQEGRANRLFLTDKGREVFDIAVPEHEAAIGRAFAGISPDEQKQLLGILKKLERSIS